MSVVESTTDAPTAAPSSCCKTKAAPPRDAQSPGSDFGAYVETGADGTARLHLMVEGIHCGGCIRKIEGALQALPAIEEARLNFTTRRLLVRWKGAPQRAGEIAGAVTKLGYRVVPFAPARLQSADAREETVLLRALAVAGFAAANVMLLSVAVWAGYFQDMGPATRGLLHWFSALVALPAILYAGRPFFTAAFAAISAGRTCMEVPITLGVLLASAMSLFETIRGGEHAYFEAAITLLFFLLIGRYLDKRARGRARSAVERLLTLDATAVTVLEPDGRQVMLPPERVARGAVVLAAAGERIGVDGEVINGHSDIDTSLISGETAPRAVGPGDRVFAGTVNHSAPLKIRVLAVGADTLLNEIVRLIELAEQRKARFVGIADRVSRSYAPAVHALALLTFLGWAFVMQAPWQQALLYAVAVLIITCPCALGLAVPAVQVIASGRLLRRGILLKSATALERFAAADTVVFDKTGTLTLGQPELVGSVDDGALREAAALAGNSRHPLARALVRAAPAVAVADGAEEVPGCGLRLLTPAGEVRLGSRAWCGVAEDEATAAGPELWFIRPGQAPQRFAFSDPPRADAAAVVAALKRDGYEVALLSGDRPATVAAVAAELGIEHWLADCRPDDKCERLAELAAKGSRVLMVGDGLNDAPALAAASVSLSPSTAADVSQTAADAVFQGERLDPVLELLAVARGADRLVKQNLGLAFGYNALTVPLAVLGYVTPLVAALCMSASSLIVVGNSLRLARVRRP
ncbi:MAG: heavy metal translocating P-type ATPase [Kiloniellales bacterium]